MAYDAWMDFQCLACCSNIDSVTWSYRLADGKVLAFARVSRLLKVTAKDEVPAEKLVPVATVFSRPVDAVTLADPCAEEVLRSRQQMEMEWR